MLPLNKIYARYKNYACYGFKNWKYVESPAHNLDESGFEEFDSTFPQMEKGYKYTQELFYIYSRSNVLR